MTPELAVALYGWLLALSVAIPWFIGRKWGMRAALIVTAIWTAIWFIGFARTGDYGGAFAFSIAAAVVWTIGAAWGGVTRNDPTTEG